LRSTSVTATTVGLAWRRAKHGRRLRYAVYRDGRRVGMTAHTTFLDTALRPSTTYAYWVQALDPRGHGGRHSRRLRVHTGTQHLAPGPSLASGPSGGAAGGPPLAAATVLSTTMVERLFWRAGFGPSDGDRSAWTGRPLGDLVDFFLSSPSSQLDRGTVPAPTSNGHPIDPLVSDDDLIMEWLDRMQWAANPFVERLTFFWHRHFAVSRDSGIPAEWLLAYRNRLHSYADLGANPTASFRALALDMTTNDGAMSYFLTGYQNVKSHPNENYGREFMELFCLGVRDSAGNPNYTQTDVMELARAFTGWQLDFQPASATYGQTHFSPVYHDAGSKTILGQTIPAEPSPSPLNASQAVDVVLAHPSHAPFLVRKLWNEFHHVPIPDDALADCVATYTAGGQLQLKPLLRKILSHPLIFDRLDEPPLVKPPVVFVVGVLKAMGAPLRDYFAHDALDQMQQLPYHPPNVAGWEGGLSWLNTGTATARFQWVVTAQYVKWSNANPVPDAGPGETPQQAFDRAYAESASPWLSSATRQQILNGPAQLPADTASRRHERQYALRALMLGGPDAQVM
jgi:uncharacterized protein (DUF1800 family)